MARWRAARIDSACAPSTPLVDLTCGLGSDAWAAAANGRPVLAIDCDPGTAQLAALNLERTPGRALAARADAQSPPLAGAYVALIDPDRRAEGSRELDPERWSPPWSAAIGRLAAARGGCAKLAPTADVEALDPTLPTDLERRWTWIGLGRELVEVALWTGVLAAGPGERFSAVVLERDGSVRGSLEGSADDRRPAAPLAPEAAGAIPWVLEPHPAVIRSGLIGALAAGAGAAPLGPQLAFLGAPERPEHPLARTWRVLASAPADRKRVRAMLREHDVGRLELRVRGHPESPDRLAKAWRGPGLRKGTLLVARLGEGHRAYLVEES